MLKVGDSYTHEVKFRQEDVASFARTTGDDNPIHLDAEFAAKTPFGRPIVHGIYSLSVFSMIFGTKFPGEGTIYLAQDAKFLAPVFVGQYYKAKVEVLEVDSEKHRGVLRVTLEDENQKIAVDGIAKLLHKTQF